MGRAPRADEAGGIYHAMNRGNARQQIVFLKIRTTAGQPLQLAWRWLSDRIGTVTAAPAAQLGEPHESGKSRKHSREVSIAVSPLAANNGQQ